MIILPLYLKLNMKKLMLHRLTIALAQVKASDKSEDVLNEIRKIIYWLYQSEEITKKSVWSWT